MLVTDNNNSTFDPVAFLAHAGLGRRIIEVKPKQPFFTKEIEQTPSFIFRAAVQDSPSFRRTAKRPQSHFSRPVILLERSPLPQYQESA